MDGSGQFKRRTLCAEDSYTKESINFELHPRLADVLRGLENSISENPEKYDIVRGFQKIRIAKSDYYTTPKGILPRLRIHFRIEENESVTLLHVESYTIHEDGEID